jgi:hypothetical protein
VEKIRKFGEKLWYYKERIVFVVMLGILCWHLYKGWTAPAAEALAIPRSPMLTNDDLPKEPPPPFPAAPMPGQWRGIFTPNPFWYNASPAGASTQQAGPEDVGIKLLRIQTMPNGQLRAQLETTTVKWYSEGDKFESFELLSIDPAGKCQVYSERIGKVIDLTLPGV